MPQKLSNHLKAVIYPENLLENDVRILREHCAMITQFSYQCSRSRNDAGYPYGKTLPSTIDFTVRLGVPEDGKLYYEQMHQNQPATFTFIFNATFGAYDRLADYEDAMIVKGFVVDVEDDYTSADGEDAEQMLVHVCLLINSIIYNGRDRNRTLEIYKSN